MTITSLQKKSVRRFKFPDSPVTAVVPAGNGCFVTGHGNGTIRHWNPATGKVLVAPAHEQSVSLVARDRYGRIFAAAEDGMVRATDFSASTGASIGGLARPISRLASYPDGRLLIASDPLHGACPGEPALEIRLLDTGSGRCEVLRIPIDCRISSLKACFDGRIVVGLRRGASKGQGTLVIADPGVASCHYWLLPGHLSDTSSCITMGPRVITSGTDESDSLIRIWGTEQYVQTEHSRLSLLQGARTKPPYYRSIF